MRNVDKRWPPSGEKYGAYLPDTQSQHHYDQSQAKGQLWPRFLRVLGIHLGALAGLALVVWFV